MEDKKKSIEFVAKDVLDQYKGRLWLLGWVTERGWAFAYLKLWKADVMNICQVSQHWTSPTFLQLTLREQLWILQLHWGHVSLEDPELSIIL